MTWSGIRTSVPSTLRTSAHEALATSRSFAAATSSDPPQPARHSRPRATIRRYIMSSFPRAWAAPSAAARMCSKVNPHKKSLVQGDWIIERFRTCPEQAKSRHDSGDDTGMTNAASERWMVRGRLLLALCLVPWACTAANTPAQNLAYERWAKCGGAFVQLQRVDLDGRISFTFSDASRRAAVLQCLTETGRAGPTLPEPRANPL